MCACRVCVVYVCARAQGTTHFCSACHSNPNLVVGLDRAKNLPKCPAGPLGKALGRGCPCPLKSKHPHPGVEFSLGCGLCVNVATF
jgi:hypothetical protein